MKFKVTVYQEWKEYGEVTVEADGKEEAREIVMGMLADGDDDIEWDADQDPGGHGVEEVEKA